MHNTDDFIYCNHTLQAHEKVICATAFAHAATKPHQAVHALSAAQLCALGLSAEQLQTGWWKLLDCMIVYRIHTAHPTHEEGFCKLFESLSIDEDNKLYYYSINADLYDLCIRYPHIQELLRTEGIIPAHVIF